MEGGGRLFSLLLTGAVAFVILLVVVYRVSKKREEIRAPKGVELDVATRPSEWRTDSWDLPGDRTAVGIVRVARDTQEVLARRHLTTLDNTAPDYGTQLDAALDAARVAMRAAQVHLDYR